MPLLSRSIIAGAMLWLFASTCAAQSGIIIPSTEVTANQKRLRVEAQLRHAVTTEGAGGVLRLFYTSPSPLEVDFAPMTTAGAVDPNDQIFFSLPAAQNQEVMVNLTVSPGWSPLTTTYYIAFFGPKSDDAVRVTEAEFLPVTVSDTVRAALRGFLHRERFQVSGTHTLRGSHVLGIPLTGIAALITFAVAVMLWSRRKDVMLPVFSTVAIGALAFNAWFGIDLLRFTVMNMTDWFSTGAYAEAGTAREVAAEIRSAARKTGRKPLVYICNDTANFYPKVLRYFAYPVPVSTEKEDIPRTKLVVVPGGSTATFENGLLQCGYLTGTAKVMKVFGDNATLFEPAS